MLRKIACGLIVSAGFVASAHDVITTKVTWSREISRLVMKRCASCHQAGGPAFSLMTYEEARPWAKAIKEEALERRMPPFGAVKGFSDLRDDESLTQEELHTISDWVEGGAPEGDKNLLPKQDMAGAKHTARPRTGKEYVVDGTQTLAQPMTFVGIKPKSIISGSTVRVVAQRPDGSVTPLLWLYQFNPKFERTYYFTKPIALPAGTRILTSSPDAGTLSLLMPGATSAPKPAL